MTISKKVQNVLDNISKKGIEAFHKSFIVVDGEADTDWKEFETFIDEVYKIDETLDDKETRELNSEMRFKR